jgi:hypothetical protein
MRHISPTLVFAAALVFSASGSALLAQDQSQPAAGATLPAATSQASQPHKVTNPHHQAKRMAKKLGLTPDQQSKIEPILADRDQQVQSLRADTTLAPRDRRAKLRDIRQDSDTRIEAFLSDTQKQQYEQMKQQHTHGQQQGVTPPTS